MVSKFWSPKDRVVRDPFQITDLNGLLTGMIFLQVPFQSANKAKTGGFHLSNEKREPGCLGL